METYILSIFLNINATKKGLQNDYNFNDYEKVIKHIESLNIPIIDLNKELFSKNKDPLSFFPFRKRAAGFSHCC